MCGIPKAGLKGEELHEWSEETNYSKGIEVKVEGGGLEVASNRSAEVKFTPKKTGMFEIGCHTEGHYEAGMKSVLVVK